MNPRTLQQYSRVLGVCFDERTGKDLNREMVKAGEAVAYQQFSKVCHLQAVECALASHKAFLSWQEYFFGMRYSSKDCRES